MVKDGEKMVFWQALIIKILETGHELNFYGQS